MADKEMQFSPMDLPNKPEFALENSLFVLRNRACRGGRGFKPLTLGKYYDSKLFANAARCCSWVISRLSVALCSPCSGPGFGTGSALSLNHCQATFPILDTLEMTDN